MRWSYRKLPHPARVRFVCEDPDCAFNSEEGLPLRVIDEQIYDDRQIAAAYEQAAANQDYPPDERAELSRKAKLWLWLAMRSAERLHGAARA
jgi:hypothetical protein